MQKKCYSSIMENIELVNQTIAKNLIFYRKAAGLTQAEVAQKINYSDKSVSKWESGNGVPDIYILMQLADLFGVTVNDLIGVGEKVAPIDSRKKRNRLHLLIMLLSSGIVWLLATSLFVCSNLIAPERAWWLYFLFAIPVNAIVLIVFSGVWKYKTLNFISVSVLIWTLITAIFVLLNVTVGSQTRKWWLLYVLGAPVQLLEIEWTHFRYRLKRAKASKGLFTKPERKRNRKEKEKGAEG